MHSKKGLLKCATLLLLFATTRSSVSVLVHIPHASVVLLMALSGPLSSTVCVCRLFSAWYKSLSCVSKESSPSHAVFSEANCPKKNFPTNLAKANECGRFCPKTPSFIGGLLAKTFLVLFLGSVRGSIPPWASVARWVFQLCVSMCLLNLARARSSPQFWHFTPEPNFPKNLPLFWIFTPSPIFPKIRRNFWDFSRIQTLGTFRFVFPLL